MEEEVIQPKAGKIISTVILIIFLAFVCFLCWLAVDLLIGVTNYSPDASNEFGDLDGEEMLMVVIFAGVAMAAPYLLILISVGLIFLNSLICLGCSISNTRVKNKPVKIINIVLSCCFAAALVLGVITIILLRVL